MTAITPFLFEDEHLVRVVTLADEPWFVAADVCRCLEIANPRDALGRLDADEKATVGNADGRAGHGAQQFNIVSEPGVYRLVFTSRKPAAERFKRWLAHDVLPAIRKTGRYEAPSPADAPVADLRAAVDLVREARLTFGRAAARRLWRSLPLPRIEDAALPHADDLAGPDCLRHLLAADLADRDGTSRTVREWACATAANDARAIDMLRRHGMAVRPAPAGRGGGQYLWVAYRHPAIATCFQARPGIRAAGCGRWRPWGRC